jgi:hypothetical protein
LNYNAARSPAEEQEATKEQALYVDYSWSPKRHYMVIIDPLSRHLRPTIATDLRLVNNAPI